MIFPVKIYAVNYGNTNVVMQILAYAKRFNALFVELRVRIVVGTIKEV